VYDARHYRIRQQQYNSTGHYVQMLDDYFSSQWQVMETRQTTASNGVGTLVLDQYVWGQSAGSYVDELVLRDRDTAGEGTLDERFYVTQDANFNVTAILNTSSTIQERYAYSPYGQQMILSAGYSAESSSGYVWQFGHQGLYHDANDGLIYNRN
jgi:hypothetical protein